METVRITDLSQQNKHDFRLCPVVSCLYVPESLVMEAHRQGLSISNHQTSKGKRKRSYEAPQANCTWFYSNNKVSRKKVIHIGKKMKRNPPSNKLLVSAHQNSVMKTKCPRDFYEVEYISDIQIHMVITFLMISELWFITRR